MPKSKQRKNQKSKLRHRNLVIKHEAHKARKKHENEMEEFRKQMEEFQENMKKIQELQSQVSEKFGEDLGNFNLAAFSQVTGRGTPEECLDVVLNLSNEEFEEIKSGNYEQYIITEDEKTND